MPRYDVHTDNHRAGVHTRSPRAGHAPAPGVTPDFTSEAARDRVHTIGDFLCVDRAAPRWKSGRRGDQVPGTELRTVPWGDADG